MGGLCCVRWFCRRQAPRPIGCGHRARTISIPLISPFRWFAQACSRGSPPHRRRRPGAIIGHVEIEVWAEVGVEGRVRSRARFRVRVRARGRSRARGRGRSAGEHGEPIGVDGRELPGGANRRGVRGEVRSHGLLDSAPPYVSVRTRAWADVRTPTRARIRIDIRGLRTDQPHDTVGRHGDVRHCTSAFHASALRGLPIDRQLILGWRSWAGVRTRPCRLTCVISVRTRPLRGVPPEHDRVVVWWGFPR